MGSLTFGFCSIWSLHFVAMLACELDLPIGVDVPLTLLSAALAVLFTFAALASDLLWDRYKRGSRGGSWSRKRKGPRSASRNRPSVMSREDSFKPLLDTNPEEDEGYNFHADEAELASSPDVLHGIPLEVNDYSHAAGSTPASDTSTQSVLNDWSGQDSTALSDNASPAGSSPFWPGHNAESQVEAALPDNNNRAPSLVNASASTPSERPSSQRSPSSFMGSSSSSYGLGNLMNIAYRSTSPAKNAFVGTAEALYTGCTWKNIIKGFLWSLAITSMHYSGVAALRVPDGYYTLNLVFVVLSGLISWAVCLVGCILMSQMETHLTQQILFSIVATVGVAAMHFTGMPSPCRSKSELS